MRLVVEARQHLPRMDERLRNGFEPLLLDGPVLRWHARPSPEDLVHLSSWRGIVRTVGVLEGIRCSGRRHGVIILLSFFRLQIDLLVNRHDGDDVGADVGLLAFSVEMASHQLLTGGNMARITVFQALPQLLKVVTWLVLEVCRNLHRLVTLTQIHQLFGRVALTDSGRC